MKSIVTFCSTLILCAAAGLASAQTPPPPAVPAKAPGTPTVPAVTAPPMPPAIPVPPKPVSKDAYGNPIAPETASPSNPAPPQVAAPPVVTPFATLDSANTGAIKHEQAQANPWLAQHFGQCDANHNNEVTQAEYAACSQGH